MKKAKKDEKGKEKKSFFSTHWNTIIVGLIVLFAIAVVLLTRQNTISDEILPENNSAVENISDEKIAPNMTGSMIIKANEVRRLAAHFNYTTTMIFSNISICSLTFNSTAPVNFRIFSSEDYDSFRQGKEVEALAEHLDAEKVTLSEIRFTSGSYRVYIQTLDKPTTNRLRIDCYNLGQ